MQQRKGFTLIELIIVIFLILLIYSLVFTHYQKEQTKPPALTPLNLKETLYQTLPHGEHVTFLCIHKCRECYWKPDDAATYKRYTSRLNIKDSEVYVLDGEETLSKAQYGRFKDSEVCLMLEFFPNQSSTQIVLKNSEGTYFLPAYFGKPQKFNSLADAQAYWLANTRLISNSGDFY